MPDNVVRTLLRKATEGLVQAQQAAQAGEAQQAALELQLANKTSEAETAKAVRHGGVCELFRSWHCLVADTTPQALRRAKLDFDRRLTTRQQRFEAKTARLMRQLRHGPRTDASMALSAGGEGEDGSAALTVPVEHIAKENAYYKHANRYVVALFVCLPALACSRAYVSLVPARQQGTPQALTRSHGCKRQPQEGSEVAWHNCTPTARRQRPTTQRTAQHQGNTQPRWHADSIRCRALTCACCCVLGPSDVPSAAARAWRHATCCACVVVIAARAEAGRPGGAAEQRQRERNSDPCQAAGQVTSAGAITTATTTAVVVLYHTPGDLTPPCTNNGWERCMITASVTCATLAHRSACTAVTGSLPAADAEALITCMYQVIAHNAAAP